MKGIFAYTFLDRHGKTIASQNGQMALMPASNMKIVTGYAAYRTLGKDFKFRTSFSIEGGTVNVKGDPTPLLSGPELQGIVGSIAPKGMPAEKVNLMSEAIDSRPYVPSWEIEDRKYTYQAKITPFSINEGSIPRGSVEVDFSKLVNPHGPEHKPSRNPIKLFEQAISLASRVGGQIDVPNSGTGRVEHIENLTEVISHMETVSCNFTAELLQKYIGHKETGKKGSWSNGPKAVIGFLKKLGLDTEGIAIVDGSGLSRMNLLKTDFLAGLIHNISQSGDREFLNLLPSPGKGTLSKRLENLSHLGIHAKTGSIGYCASLTGYMEKPGVSFSIIINHSTEPGKDLPVRIDSFLGEMARKFQ